MIRISVGLQLNIAAVSTQAWCPCALGFLAKISLARLTLTQGIHISTSIFLALPCVRLVQQAYKFKLGR